MTPGLRAVLCALRDRPNSETDVLALRLRQDVTVVEAELQRAATAGLVRRGTLTHLWNITRTGRQLLETIDREPLPVRAYARMMRQNAGLPGT